MEGNNCFVRYNSTETQGSIMDAAFSFTYAAEGDTKTLAAVSVSHFGLLHPAPRRQFVSLNNNNT